MLRVRIIDVRADAQRAAGGQEQQSACRQRERGGKGIRRPGETGAGPVPTVLAEVDSDIPMAAGLGSSAAATVAGFRAFEAVAGPVPQGTLLSAASALEGHADNAAAALLGGLTSVVDGDARVLSWPWPDDLRLVVATPSSGLATSKATRATRSISREVYAVFSLQRAGVGHALRHQNTSICARRCGIDGISLPDVARAAPEAVLAIDDRTCSAPVCLARGRRSRCWPVATSTGWNACCAPRARRRDRPSR
jgi:shikimate kinase